MVNGARSMAWLVCAAALLSVLPAALGGQEARCDARTFSDVHRCAVARYRQADADEKRAYREVAARLEPYARKRLEVAEEVWSRYREAHCEYESSRMAGRREYQVVRLRCMAELTEACTALLRAT